MEYADERTVDSRLGGSSVVVWALVAGIGMGAVAKAIGQVEGPPMLIGAGVMLWVTAGFLGARHTARGRGSLDGAVWSGTTMAVYLGAWLLSYSAVFGLQQSSGFGAAWLNERVFFIIAPAASAFIGLIATASLRGDRLGAACRAAPIAWSLPEAGNALSQGWQYAVFVSLPMILLACVPLATSRHRRFNGVILATVCAGGVIAYLLLRVVDGRM
jgi:hypothetical protein